MKAKGLLWEPFRIGRMELRNRLVMPPMITMYGTPDGYVTERTKGHYAARARGGVALVIVEATCVQPQGQVFVNQLAIHHDRFIPGLRELAQAIQKHGAKAAIQLHHGGRLARPALTGRQPVAPSPLAAPERDLPRELTVAEIAEIVGCFAESALRARRAGFDGVELHSAHGYLIDEFLSRSMNKRQDGYGGDLLHRARFLMEIIKATREAVGPGFPVWCRLNGRQYGITEATTLEEAQEIARMAEGAGVDAIHVTSWGPTAPTNIPSPTFTPAVIADLAAGIKQAVTIPVIAVGSITPEAGEQLLAEGKADLIAIGRGLLADPELPLKAASGKLEDIRPCIICISCRDDVFASNAAGVRCRVNPSLGREVELRIVPADRPKKVLVIGGGPAGMEAARVAALRGHCVTLWEKGGRLGGQLIPAAVPPHKDRILALVEYYKTQMEKLRVRIELGKEATAAAVAEFEPEAVVLATGVKPFIPDIPGLDKAHAVQAVAVLEGRAEVGSRVIVIGGELVGCETAEFLAERRKDVTVTRRGPEMAQDVVSYLRPFLLERLVRKGIVLLPGVRYHEITPQGLVLTTGEGETRTIAADTIVLAAGSLPQRELYEQIKDGVPEVHLAGDCLEPRSLREAITDGYRIGLAL